MSFLNDIILGNTVRDYLLFLSILFLGLTFRRLWSQLILVLLFRLLGGRLKKDPRSEIFASLLFKPIQLFVICITCYIAFNQLEYTHHQVLFSRHYLSGELEYTVTIIEVVDKLFVFMLIFSSSWIILRIIDAVASIFKQRASSSEAKTDSQIIPFVKELSKILTIIVGGFLSMGAVFNMNVATIITGLGVGGVAVALAAKDTLQNLLGSFTIFADKPFMVGDSVQIDKYEGTIEKVGFRSTLLRTIDKTIVVIPNNKIIDAPLENLTLRNLRRIKFLVMLQYETPASAMIAISKEIKAYIHQHSATNEDTVVRFESFGEYSLNLLILYYINIRDHSDYMQIREDINYKIMDIVAQHRAHFAVRPMSIGSSSSPSGS